TPKSQVDFGGVQMEDVIASPALRNQQGALMSEILNEIKVPTIQAGRIHMLGLEPLADPMIQDLDKAEYSSGRTECDFTLPANASTPAIADFIMYRWAREAKVLKYEVLDPAPGANRSPAYAEIELSL